MRGVKGQFGVPGDQGEEGIGLPGPKGVEGDEGEEGLPGEPGPRGKGFSRVRPGTKHLQKLKLTTTNKSYHESTPLLSKAAGNVN